MKNTFLKLSVFLFLFLLVSCYSTTKVIEVNAYNCNNDNFKYEIQIKTYNEGAGYNIHNMEWEKWKYDDYDWLYTNSINGKVSADSMAFEYFQLEKTESRGYTIGGYINIEENEIEINLNFYRDGDTNKEKIPYERNGTYKLNIFDTISPVIETITGVKK